MTVAGPVSQLSLSPRAPFLCVVSFTDGALPPVKVDLATGKQQQLPVLGEEGQGAGRGGAAQGGQGTGRGASVWRGGGVDLRLPGAMGGSRCLSEGKTKGWSRGSQRR